jgi:predicted RNA-binding Zn ribbon-like protein
MKKRQSFLCIALLSTTLVANVFAGGAVATSTFGFLDSVINAAVSLLLGGDSCPVRQCQNCRPTEVVDENGNCRPRED